MLDWKEQVTVYTVPDILWPVSNDFMSRTCSATSHLQKKCCWVKRVKRHQESASRAPFWREILFVSYWKYFDLSQRPPTTRERKRFVRCAFRRHPRNRSWRRPTSDTTNESFTNLFIFLFFHFIFTFGCFGNRRKEERKIRRKSPENLSLET